MGGAGVHWDLVVDCIAFDAADVQQDVAVFTARAGHLVMISSDFVFEPARRHFPQTEEGVFTTQGYGGKKRQAELALQAADCGAMDWTVLRPCHIYGPGSLLGAACRRMGRDARLLVRLRAGEALRLVGGGHFLQQPILARDLSETILSLAGRRGSRADLGGGGARCGGIARILPADRGAVGCGIKGGRTAGGRLPGGAPRSPAIFVPPHLRPEQTAGGGGAVPATALADGLREQVLALQAA